MSSSEHDRAVERFDAARREQDRLGHEYRAAEGTSGELDAHTELRGASEETAARGRWLEWVESDGPSGVGRA